MLFATVEKKHAVTFHKTRRRAHTSTTWRCVHDSAAASCATLRLNCEVGYVSVTACCLKLRLRNNRCINAYGALREDKLQICDSSGKIWVDKLLPSSLYTVFQEDGIKS